MNKIEFIKALTDKIEKYEIEEFFKLLSNSIDTSKFKIDSLRDEWNKTQLTERMGLFNRNQAIAAYKSFFQRFIKNEFEQLTDNDIKTQQNIESKNKEQEKQYEKEFDLKFITKKQESISEKMISNNETIDTASKRPIIISVLCVIGVLSIFGTFYNITRLDELKIQISGFILLVTIFQLLLDGIHIAGLWLMKRWNILFYGINFIIGIIIELSGSVSFSGLIQFMYFIIFIRIIGILFYWTVLGVYYKKMT